jgi:hypothetical protein
MNTTPQALASSPATERNTEEGTPQFQPLLLDRHAAKSHKGQALSHAGMNFNLSSFWAHYPLLRLAGYSFSAVESPLSKKLKNFHETAQSFGEEGSWVRKKAARFLGPYDPENGKETYGNALAKGESAIFLGLAAWHAADGLRQLKDAFRPALAAELGKDEQEIDFSDLRRSNNPVIASAVDRFLWQSAAQGVAGAAFLPSLWTGIIANALVITAERTVFYRPLAFDRLSKAINDVQLNGLGEEGKEELVNNLIRTLQQTRLDHRQATIPQEQMHALRPVLRDVAEDIINRKIGITEAVYAVGGGVLIPEDPKQSRENYAHLREVRIRGVEAEAKERKEHYHLPSTKIWQARAVGQGNGERGVAESARRKALVREREAILARGPLHAAPGSGLDPDARYGSGMSRA